MTQDNEDVERDPVPQRTPENNPRDREADRGRLGRIKAWWAEWGSLVSSLWLLVITGVVLLAISTARDAADSAKETAKAAKAQSAQGAALARQNQQIIKRVDADRKRTTRQFCRLINGDQADLVKQVGQTEEYLDTPTGKIDTGETGGLNRYIRTISLPRLKLDIIRGRKRIPKPCKPQPQIVQDFRNPDQRYPRP